MRAAVTTRVLAPSPTSFLPIVASPARAARRRRQLRSRTTWNESVEAVTSLRPVYRKIATHSP